MKTHPAIGSVVGTTTAGSWSQVLVLPAAYGIVEIDDSEGSARNLGLSLLADLTDKLKNLPPDPSALPEILSPFVTAHVVCLIVLVPRDDEIQCVQYGRGSVFIKRGEEFSVLTSTDSSITGKVLPGDSILLVSGGMLKELPIKKIASVFDHLPAAAAAEKLTLFLHQSSGGGKGAALVYQAEAEAIPVPDDTGSTVVAASASGRFRLLHGIRVPAFPRLQIFHGFRKTIRSIRRSRRFAAVLFILFLFSILCISIITGLGKRTISGNDRKILEVIADSRRDLEEGTALADLNPIKGRERIVQAKNRMDAVDAGWLTASRNKQTFTDLQKQIRDTLAMVMKVYDSQPDQYYDISLLAKDALASAFALTDTTMAVLGSGGTSVYAVALPAKSGQILASGSEIPGGRIISIADDTVYVWSPAGIFRIPIGKTPEKKPVIAADAIWGNIGAMAQFGGNIYLLDTLKGRIWKYLATDGGFSDRRDYLNADIHPDLSQATSMAVDGYIWVGTSDGRILRFAQGEVQDFIPQGVDPAFAPTLYVYTTEASENLYVYEKEGKRLVVLSKDGTYVAQYRIKTGGNPSSVAVSEKLKKALFIQDGLVWGIDLK